MSLEEVFRQAHLELKPRTPIPAIEAKFFPFAGLTHTARFRDSRLIVRVSDLFVEAPETVIHALAVMLLSKLYRRRPTPDIQETYRRFILRSEIQERARDSRAARGRRPEPASPRGQWQNLEERFDRLNQTYFGGTIAKPSITWSRTRSQRVLGRYDATHRTIFVSLLFDSPNVPDIVIDYVLFHEMLHIKHPSRAENFRLVAHTAEFRAEEKSFEHYGLATAWIKKL